MVTFGGARDFGKRVYADFSEKNVTFMAAGLAYNAFVSLAPLLLLLFVVLSVVGGGLEERVVEAAEAWLPGPIADVVAQLFAGDAAAGGASVVGLVVLVWGALKIFRGLDTAFSEIYETESDNGFTDKLRDGVVVMGALVVAVLATVGVSAAVAVFSDTVPFLGLVTPLVLVAGLVLAFFPMYYVFPDEDLGWADVLPGTVFAAVGWAIFQSLFQVYLAFSDPGSSGFFGGVIVVVTYLYFTALVLLLGAVINAVRGGHSSGRPGGVGRGAGGYERKRRASLDRAELDAYLRGLDEQLTARYEATRARPDDGTDRPKPTGEVDLVEYAAGDGDERRWTVELSWSAPSGTGAGEDPSGATGVGSDRPGGRPDGADD
ncbi:YihY/virulence factor BrkB family protein [Halosimplex pelagicum]|uniref:YihY/virulence factor BrkB family protein n=1 Tax=Halosimplex pelagicum TaxID=869886 RepID=A0A7D5PFF4_9EURY|nr:YihY/virulence factor BrkB family protein [Halosimplex pelagicum]QLH82699.1 YihY/virulence factor BrkB family protein [Halosimplex pelagicum]